MSILERIAELRKEKNNISINKLEAEAGLSRGSIGKWDKHGPSYEKLKKVADFFNVSVAYLKGETDIKKEPAFSDRLDDIYPSEPMVEFKIIGSVLAGYDGSAVEEQTGEVELIPASMLRGHEKEAFFVLRVNGDSMAPQYIDGDRVLVLRCTSVDSGSVAVIMYNGDEATIKKVNYIFGEDWLVLEPLNPSYPKLRIEGPDLERCRVLGKVIKILRDTDGKPAISDRQKELIDLFEAATPEMRAAALALLKLPKPDNTDKENK